MAVIQNLKGTSYASFMVGKRGATLYQGAATPDNGTGSDGDLYIQKGTYPNNFIFQKRNGAWSKIQVGSARLDEISAVTPSDNYTLGTNASQIVLRSPTSQRSALGLGTVATLNTGTSEGDIPVLGPNGKLALSTIPLRAITDVYIVETIQERDDLLVDPGLQEGDIVIVTGTNETFIYDGTDFQLFASATGVSAITTTDPEVNKSGIVTLDAATDIVTGTMLQARGGTGFNSYTNGDLLVGNSSNGLDKLELGNENNVLSVVEGELTWVVYSASNVSFDPDTANSISATDIQGAISEVASERVFIKTASVDPTLNDDSSTNLKVGDLWFNNSTKKFFLAASVVIDNAEWHEIDSAKNLDNIYFVALNGSDTTGTGAINSPFQTINEALSASSEGSTIYVMPGTYSENVTISGIDNITIIGNDENSIISGKITISDSDGFILKNVTLVNGAGAALEAENGSENTVIDNVVVAQASDTNLAILLSGTPSGTLRVLNSRVTGIIRNSSTQVLYVENSVFDSTKIDAQAGTTYVNGGAISGAISHSGGSLYISNIAKIVTANASSNPAITSSANTPNVLSLSNVNLYRGTEWGHISKTGTCSYVFDNVAWDISDSLSGSAVRVENAASILANYTSSNYTATGTNIPGHLEGIDNRFNNITFVSLSDVPNSFTGAGGKFVKVTVAEDELEFDTASFLDLSDTPNAYAGGAADANKVLKVNSAGNAIEFGGVLATVATTGTLLSLTDTPSSYSGQTNKYLRVNNSSNAIEFVNVDASEITGLADVATDGLFSSLNDVPSSYTGSETYVVRVNSDGDGLEFVDLTASDISADRLASNYVPTDTSIKGHLDGIDSALGNITSDYLTKVNPDIEGSINLTDGDFSATNDALVRQRVLRTVTIDDTQTEMLINGINRLVLGNDSTWNFEIDIVARRTDADGEGAGWKFKGIIDRNTNAASTSLIGSVTVDQLGYDSDWDVVVNADTTNGSLRILVTGEDSKNIRWVAFVKTVEVIG